MAKAQLLKDTARVDRLAGVETEETGVELKMLNTRQRPELIKAIKLHCVVTEQPMRIFIEKALMERLEAEGGDE